MVRGPVVHEPAMYSTLYSACRTQKRGRVEIGSVVPTSRGHAIEYLAQWNTFSHHSGLLDAVSRLRYFPLFPCLAFLPL